MNTRSATITPPTDELPEYITVFRSEKDLPCKGAKRRHAYKIWGSGSGKIAWSEETTDSLQETRWAPKEMQYPPADGRYMLHLIDVKIGGQKIGRTGPIVIDPRARPKSDQKIITWERYKVEDHLHRSRMRNSDRVRDRKTKLEEMQQGATNEAQRILLGLGPRRLYLMIQDHAAQARVVRKALQSKPEQRAAFMTTLDHHLSIIEEAAKILATLKWR